MPKVVEQIKYIMERQLLKMTTKFYCKIQELYWKT